MSTSASMVTFASALALVVALGEPGLARQGDVFDRVTHGFAVSEGGVKIHYATLGQGPLVVMIHGTIGSISGVPR